MGGCRRKGQSGPGSPLEKALVLQVENLLALPLGCSGEARSSWSFTCTQVSIPVERKEKTLGLPPAPGALGGRLGLTLPCQGRRGWRWEESLADLILSRGKAQASAP